VIVKSLFSSILRRFILFNEKQATGNDLPGQIEVQVMDTKTTSARGGTFAYMYGEEIP